MYSAEVTPVILFTSKLPRAVFQALFFVLIAQSAGGPSLAKFALLGNAVHAAVFPLVIEMSIVIEVNKWSGMLANLIAAPGHWLPTLLGRSVASYIDTLLSMTLVVAVLTPIIAPDIQLLNLRRALPLLLMTVACAAGLGWLCGAVSVPIRLGALVSNTVAYVTLVVCGVNFPLTALPPAIQLLGRCVPMTHGLLAIRAVVAGAAYTDVLGLMGAELLLGVVYGAAAWLVFGYQLHVARATGSYQDV